MAVTLDTLKKTIGKKKVKSMAYAWLADYESMAGDMATALARVDAGLQLYPGDIPGMLVRTKILFQQGEFDECIKECEKVLEKEPFCLSAQKRMGDAYDKLENIDERNRCYRRVHDMDPLDSFWKDEYEAVPETLGAAAVAGAVGEAVADSEFAMPDMEGLVGENVPESTEPAENDATTEAAPAEEQPEDSLFSKSLDMDIDSAPAEEPTATDVQPEPEQPKSYASPFSAAADDDPFAALASLGSDDSLVDESAMDSLQQSLESAMDSNLNDVSLDQEIPEGEEISGNDLDSAFSNLFGDEDELDTPDEAPVSASPFAQADLPTSLDDDSEVPEEKPQSIFSDDKIDDLSEDSVEDKPQSVDSAFSDIFGEDELPEELPPSQPVEKADAAPSAEPAEEEKSEGESSLGGLFEKSAAAAMGFGTVDDALKLEEPEAEPEPQEADKPQSLDSAFADIFGEDELPEELPVAESAEPASEVTQPAEDKTDAFDGLDIANWSPDAKTEDTLEAPAEESLELPAEPAAPEDSLDLTLDAVPEEPAQEEPAVEAEPAEESLELPAESAAPEEALDLTLDAVPEEPAAIEEPSVETESVAQEEPAVEAAPVADAEPAQEEPETEGFSVDKAFDALFAEEDELPEEKPVEEQQLVEEPLVEEKPSDEFAEAAPVIEDAPAEEAPAAENTDKVSGDAATVEVAEAPAEPTEETSEKEELDKEMGAAFSSLFAEDDDLELPETSVETPAPAPTQEDTGAVIEEAPLEGTSLESDLDKSFSSLFGEDDSLEENPAPAEKLPAEESAAELEVVAEKPTGDADSLESEFSGAFKQLFDTDDDSLDEKENLPSNKGVDFLMSGDSDDEVSAGLVKDPTVPLDKMPTDLDESLNTPTLAEIYFEQGLYGKAIDIYQDLARKEPENETIRKRLDEIEAAYRTKFGENTNG